MNVMRLIEDLPITGSMAGGAEAAAREVRGISHDSRRVAEGDLYVAIVGERFDGRVFAADAERSGAAAVLGAGQAPADLTIPWLETEDPRQMLGPLAARLYGHPDREMVTVGVTGTNGKSTTIALIAAILEAAGKPTGLIGTLGYVFGEIDLFSEADPSGARTTPEAPDLFRVLRRMRDIGAEAVTMEVSSHALSMERVAGMSFDLGLFTNLTRDHFDFHLDFEHYYAAKRRLFDLLKSEGRAVVNVSDAYGRRLASELPQVLSYGAGGDVEVLSAELSSAGTLATFRTPRGELELSARLLGSYNLENIAGAVAAAEALELSQDAVVTALETYPPLPGRMEPVDAGQDFPVLVDFAHTDAALEAALRSLKSIADRKVILVFGCGGDRDAGKRVLMGRVAGELADLPIVTSDNPRDEDPMTIIAAVEEGLRQSGNEAYRVVPDRREAIRRAVAHADAGWSVLVAGKGHESGQIVGDRVLPFSDHQELLTALEERRGAGTGG